MEVNLNKIRISFILILTYLLIPGAAAQVDPDDTLWGIAIDSISNWFSYSEITRNTEGLSEWTALISAFLITVLFIYKAAEYFGEKFLSGFHSKLSESIDSRGRINYYLLLSFLGTLAMGELLTAWLLTIVGTVQGLGFIGMLLLPALLGGLLLAGAMYGGGAVGSGMAQGGNKLAKGANDFWNSDPIEAGRSAAKSMGGTVKDLAQTSTRVDNFAASTAQTINEEVDTRSHDYCVNMHQNTKGNRGGNCSTCGDPIP